MFSIKKNFWVLTIAFSILAGCTSKQSGDEDQPLPVAPDQPPAQPAAADPVSGQRWCRMDDWEDFQIALRMTAKGDQMQMEFIRIYPDGSQPVRYQYPVTTVWEPKKDENPMFGKFSILAIKDPAEIAKLGGFDEQKRISEKVVPKYTQLAKHEGTFNPDIAITVKTRDLESGNVTARNMYPCSYYSSTLLEDAPVRPFMEVVMLISKNMGTYTPEGMTNLSNSMSLVEPMDEIKMAPENLINTQWCSWREVEADRLFLRTVSIGNAKFLENKHSENFRQFPDDASVMSYLQDNAKNSEEYTWQVADGRLTGKKVTAKDPMLPVNELFTFMQDATGTKAMVRLLPKEPENSRPRFDEIYFECSNTKPFQFSTGFAARLPAILDLQMKEMNPPPPPPPPPPPATEGGGTPTP